jgi:hypothetical protein
MQSKQPRELTRKTHDFTNKPAHNVRPDKGKLVYSTLTLNQKNVEWESVKEYSRPRILLSSRTRHFPSARDKPFEHTEICIIVVLLASPKAIIYFSLRTWRKTRKLCPTALCRLVHLSVLEIISTMPMLSHHCERLLIENCPKIIHNLPPLPTKKASNLSNLFSYYK